MTSLQLLPNRARREVTSRSGRLVRWIMLAGMLLTLASSAAVAQPGGRGGDALGSLFGADEPEVERGSGVSLTASDELVADIRVEGTRAIPVTRVLSQLSTRIGRPFDPQLVRKDVRKLVDLPWFVDVQTYTERTSEGLVVVFKVVERPTIRYIEYWGNEHIRDRKLAKETGLKVGATLDPFSVNEGRNRIEQLYRDNGYSRVQVTIVEGTKQGDKGVIYSINEGDQKKVWKVEFEGNQFASDGQLETRIKCKPGFVRLFGGYVDREQIERDKQLLTDYYRSFGFFQATAAPKLEWNDAGSWATIRWIIYEGPQSQVRNVTILGNQLFATEDLTSRLKLPGGQQFERAKVQGDVEWLKQLYGSRGYVFTDVQADVRFLEEPGQVDLVYTIEEGKRFRVGRVIVHIGGDNPHTRIQTALNRLSIRPGEIVDIRELRASERRLMQSALFHSEPARNIYPKITFRIPDPETEVYSASEGPNVRGQSPDDAPAADSPLHTYIVANSLPAEAHVPTIDMEMSIDEMGQVEVISYDPPAANPVVHEVRRNPLPDDQSPSSAAPRSPYSNLQFDQPSRQPYRQNSEPIYRGQSPQPQISWTSGEPAAAPPVAAPASNGTYPPAATTAAPVYGGQPVQATDPSATMAPSSAVQPAQYIDQVPPPPLGNSAPITPFPSVGPYPGPPVGLPVPFSEPVVDVEIDLQETQTGRFVMGVGVNSDAGVVGQILLDEKNFDWRRPPTSWQDMVNGTAWRGGGQRFRLEAAPGSQVQRYLASFQEPYFLDTPVSLTLSGSYYDRRFTDWDEQRLGGRIGLGYQWTQSDVSTNVSYRGEEVTITRPSSPVEPELQEVLGSNALHGFRLAVINNTRDSDFLPTQGHYMEVYGEQVVGSFTYPRGGIDLRKYFLMRERGDHTGRHVLSLSTQVNITGDDTPIYEHFFAGGFSTMRGFDYRGASPVSLATGVTVGGEFQWLNSVEYMFPLTADDMLHGVVFCDFGTTEPDVSVDHFRVAPGVGLRITIPAMGPAPIALDFAWPVAREDFDDLQVFSFNVGFLR